MASADLANIAAAATAGYKEVAYQGVTAWHVMLEKPITGDPDGGAGGMIRSFGQGVTQSAAESVALANLNNKRLHRYGADAGVISNGKKNVNAHTRDVT